MWPLRVPATGISPNSGRTLTVAYIGLVLFSIVYFVRPEDWIPGAVILHLAMVAGVLALVSFVFGLFAHKLRLTRQTWVLFALYAQLCLSIPFSTWKGGSFNKVIVDFSKNVLIMLLITQTVNTFSRLRRLLFIQTATIACVLLVSAFLRAGGTATGRTVGALHGMFDNPNDLAASINMAIPFAIAFFLVTQNPFKRLAWLGALGVMGYSLVTTYSRGGFLTMLAMMVCCTFLLLKRNRGLVLFLLMVGLLCAIGLGYRGRYAERMRSIVSPELDQTRSYDSRVKLLVRSLSLIVEHPLVGVGPGQFAQEGGLHWQVAHNSYTEIAAEAGIPAAVFFIWMLVSGFRAAWRIRAREQLAPEIALFGSALAASYTAMLVAMLFASFEYNLFPYFIMGYVGAFEMITSPSLPSHGLGVGREISRASNAEPARELKRDPCAG